MGVGCCFGVMCKVRSVVGSRLMRDIAYIEQSDGKRGYGEIKERSKAGTGTCTGHGKDRRAQEKGGETRRQKERTEMEWNERKRRGSVESERKGKIDSDVTCEK